MLLDRRPVLVDLWTSVPSYEVKVNKVPRTVLATNKMEDLDIFLEFSDHIINTTTEIVSALQANAGNFKPVHSKTHGSRRFVFKVRDACYSSQKVFKIKRMQHMALIITVL